jgi:hypothetical protein
MNFAKYAMHVGMVNLLDILTSAKAIHKCIMPGMEAKYEIFFCRIYQITKKYEVLCFMFVW